MCLVLHHAEKILDIYAELRNTNNIFFLAILLKEILGRDTVCKRTFAHACMCIA